MKQALRTWSLVVLIATCVGIAGAQTCGCSGSQGSSGGSGIASQVGAFVANAEACAKAEAQAVASGVSILDVANAVSAIFTFASSPDPNTAEAAIAGLITTYGEPIIACAVVKGEQSAPMPAAGSGSGSAAPRSENLGTILRHELAEKRGWQPTAP
jgi:hypothetical protein